MDSFVGNCLKCGYPLVRLTTPRCPECGTPFDPDNPATMEFHPKGLQKFLTKKITVWTLFPAFMTTGGAVAATISDFPLAHALQFLAIVTLIPTYFICHARTRFQTWLRNRNRQRGGKKQTR